MHDKNFISIHMDNDDNEEDINEYLIKRYKILNQRCDEILNRIKKKRNKK